MKKLQTIETETVVIKTVEDAIAYSKENLKQYPSPELRDLIVQTAKCFPPIFLWKKAFADDKGMKLRFDNLL